MQKSVYVFLLHCLLVCISQNNIDNKNFNKEIKTSNNETVDFFSTASKFIKDPKKEVTALVV